MPGRYLRDGILTSVAVNSLSPKDDRRQRFKRDHVAARDRREISAMPCAVCNLPGLTVVDHILPVARGGGSERGNLQPLCSPCNYKKKHRLTNDQLRALFLENRVRHITHHYFKLARLNVNPYDGPFFHDWLIRWLGGLC